MQPVRVGKDQILALYRRILRTHRAFPPELRYMGDQYARDEFRRHQHVDNAVFISQFYEQWRFYAEEMERQHKSGAVQGRALDPTVLDQMNDQQIGQLWELRKEAKKPKEI
ncbi:acetate non-utilizing protein 9 [Allomyces javanicus]|nr:acetate non-utilizing protein 9 [Allomyces javanicus]